MRRRVGLVAATVLAATALTTGVISYQHSGPECHIRAAGSATLPDRHCTPGLALAGVGPESVCTPGWARAHRDVPAEVRSAVLRRYGFDPGRFHGELDHLISLELGGTNDPAHLWPEAGKIPNPKDRLENRLHRLVCSGRLDLVVAQREIADDWTAVR